MLLIKLFGQETVRIVGQSKPGVGNLFDSWATIVLKLNKGSGEEQIEGAFV